MKSVYGGTDSILAVKYTVADDNNPQKIAASKPSMQLRKNCRKTLEMLTTMT